MRLRFAGLFFLTFISLLSGCGTLYEHKSDVPGFPYEVTSTLAIGDTREKVHSVLGEPLVDAPDHSLEVYRRSGSDFSVGWIIAPWVPLPVWGDETIVIVLVVFDEQEIVRDISVGSWKETNYRFGSNAVDAGGFSFLNTSFKEPATLLAPPVSSKDLVAFATDHKTCSLIIVMGHCPMEKTLLNGHVIADFPYSGMSCSVEGGTSQLSGHELYDTLLWKRIEPGMHKISVRQRMFSGNFEESFECKPGEIIYAQLRGTKWNRERWTVHRLEGAIHVTKGNQHNLAELDGTRFILWHSGTWFGMPNKVPGQ
jgi:uncharacterized protein YceK